MFGEVYVNYVNNLRIGATKGELAVKAWSLRTFVVTFAVIQALWRGFLERVFRC